MKVLVGLAWQASQIGVDLVFVWSDRLSCRKRLDEVFHRNRAQSRAYRLPVRYAGAQANWDQDLAIYRIAIRRRRALSAEPSLQDPANSARFVSAASSRAGPRVANVR